MGGIEGAEWIGVVIMAFAVLAGVLLVVSAHGDMKVKTHYENNDDEEAADVMVDLIQRTSWRLVVHDDGNDTPASIYNNERVINALDERMAKRRWLQVRCLFNYKGQPLKFLRLIDKYGGRMKVWYTTKRPDGDIHYKIVDGGKMVHLSVHKPEVDQRRYSLRTPPSWAIGTRFRISRKYRAHFKENAEIPAVSA